MLATTLGLAWDGYDQIRDTQGELGAVDCPYRHAMNVGGFMVLGASMLAFAATYHRELPRGIAQRLATWLLCVRRGDGDRRLLPLRPGLRRRHEYGPTHGLFSAPGAIGLPVAVMLSASVFRLDRHSPFPPCGLRPTACARDSRSRRGRAGVRDLRRLASGRSATGATHT